MIFHNKSTARLRRMLEAIRSRDFTLQYNLEGLTGEERKLCQEINAVISEFRETLTRQDAQYGYYETLLNQVDACLVVANDEGRVLWMNQTAQNRLCGFRFPDLSTLALLHPQLPAELNALTAGQQKLLRLNIRGSEEDWSISMVRYSRKGMDARLLTLQNVQSVLQQSEVDAQKRLVRVLTHEIMNSLSPIISLSDTLLEMDECLEGEARTAMQAIHRRSQGLLEFVENYRSLSRLSPPEPGWVTAGGLVSDLQRLYPQDCIRYIVEDSSDELYIDRHQMEQVLINLLKNALEACADEPRPSISLQMRTNRAERRHIISITDNGQGILPDVMERIFVPFFTTKQHGSGIGLSLCRQIVTNHGGIIRVTSHTEPEHHGSTFAIELPIIYRE